MSFSDTIFLFFLALILFGPKRLPEMAKKAGRLMAELRRASNEFKSQIETEIAHLEVEKSQTVLPPTAPPQGTVASMSLNPAAATLTAHDSPDTLAGPTAETAPPVLNAATAPADLPVSNSTEAPAEPSATTAQESHV